MSLALLGLRSSIFTTAASCTAAWAFSTTCASAALWACSWRTTAPSDTRGALIITSNVPFDGWGKLLGDEVLAAAILDRLLHQSEIFAINGPSYRLKDKLPAGAEPSP